MNDAIPQGFVPWPPPSPFMVLMGPLYRHELEDGSAVLALRIEHRHMNLVNIAHGGMLATLADSALGHNIVRRTGASVVTVQMSVEYLGAVRQGDWLEAHVAIEKPGRRLIHATCRLKVSGRAVLKASGVFAVRRDAGRADANFDG